jgi:hypothetical protein
MEQLSFKRPSKARKVSQKTVHIELTNDKENTTIQIAHPVEEECGKMTPRSCREPAFDQGQIKLVVADEIPEMTEDLKLKREGGVEKNRYRELF